MFFCKASKKGDRRVQFSLSSNWIFHHLEVLKILVELIYRDHWDNKGKNIYPKNIFYSYSKIRIMSQSFRAVDLSIRLSVTHISEN